MMTQTAVTEALAFAALFVARRATIAADAREILDTLSGSELLECQGNGPLGHVFARLSSICALPSMPAWQTRRLAPASELAQGALAETAWLCERYDDEHPGLGFRALASAMRS